MNAQSLLVAVAVTLPSTALACGGFFCSNGVQMDQSAERIVFAVDEEGRQVTAHVQIFYQGEATDFAWVVPVASPPELFLSSDDLFQGLTAATAPTYFLKREILGDCRSDNRWGTDYDVLAESAPSSSGGDNGVTVVSISQVGPYLTAVIAADSSRELTEWLDENGFDIPDEADAALKPYVAGGSYFVALKLLADKEVGDLQPLGMRYEGTGASVPIQLTAIAAVPDMRLEVYLLGDHRAVPSSYLHVQINDALVDWWNAGDNYEEVITQAANEAGGHAFATDFTGSTERLRGTVFDGSLIDLEALRHESDPDQFLFLLQSQGFSATALLLEILQDYMPIPADSSTDDPTSFYNCPSCYSDNVVFDVEGMVDALEALIVGPARAAEALLWDYGHITRLTSSLDAVEMTVDPTFVFNADMEQELHNGHRAIEQYLCTSSITEYEANRRLVLPDGRIYNLPSEQWLDDAGMTEHQFMRQNLANIAALVIEETGPVGDPNPLYDGRADALEESLAFNGFVAELLGACGGCDASGGAGAPLAITSLALLLGLRRRREG